MKTIFKKKISILPALAFILVFQTAEADRNKINLTIERRPINNSEIWEMNGDFTVNKSVAVTFLAAKQFERIPKLTPYINIFKLSPDRKKLKSGIKIFPGLSFEQSLHIGTHDKTKVIHLDFTTGLFSGLRAKIYFTAVNNNQTSVKMTSSGILPRGQVPFFLTNSIVLRLSRSLIKNWREQVESE